MCEEQYITIKNYAKEILDTPDFMTFAKSIYPELKKNIAMSIAFDDLYRCEQRHKIIMEQSKPFMKMFDNVYSNYRTQYGY